VQFLTVTELQAFTQSATVLQQDASLQARERLIGLDCGNVDSGTVR
jgi:hypothetical protein